MRRPERRAGAALLAAGAAVLCLGRPALAAEGFAIVGATVLDGTGGPPRRDAIVIVEGESIRAVGPRATVPLPKGLRIVDGRGRWVMPGLVDAHVHFFQSGGPYTRPDVLDLRARRPYAREVESVKAALPRTFARYLLCGITSVADVGGPMWNFDVRGQAQRTLLAPRVAVAGPLVSTVARPQLDLGDPPIIQVDSPEGARALVRRLAPQRPDFIKVWFITRAGADDPAAGKALLQATVEEARAHGIRTAVHATELEGARAAVEAGASVLVHSVWDRPVDDAFIALLKERGTLYVPTLFVGRGYDHVLSGTFEPTVAERRLADPEALAAFEEIKAFPEFAPRTRGDGARVQRAMENLRRLAGAGVLVAVGTDAGNIGTLHGPSIFRELRLMVEAGLTPAQVLTAATRGGARVMGREDIGVVATGALADLVVLDGDPTSDLGVLEAPRHVVKGGRILEMSDLARAAGPGARRP